jgi:translation initiation factor 1
VVRYERKGRGGKEATVIEGLDLVPNALDEWLSALKVALGCGGTVENGKLVLQGDQRTRLGVLLANRGVRRVVIG